MKNLSVREFRDICSSKGVTNFILASDNQNHNLISNTLRIDLVFDSLLIAFNPNAICLKNENGFVCFERVKYIRMNPDNSPLGIKFTIVCGDFSSNENNTSYTIIGN